MPDRIDQIQLICGIGNLQSEINIFVKMNYLRLFKYLTVDPVSLSVKARFLSLMACFCSILFIAFITSIFFPWPGYPMLVASMGASSIILFFIPGSPLAQPWPFVGGQLVSATVGVFCAQNIVEIPIAAAAAVGGSVLMMLLLRCMHPPAAATSLTPVTAGYAITSLGYSFVFVPVAVNVAGMLLLTFYFNRLLMARDYPSLMPEQKKQAQRAVDRASGQQIGFSAGDLEQALEESDVFIDMTHAELSHLLTRAEINTFKRIKGPVLCAHVMHTEFETVEFDTEVEEAWKRLCANSMKAMPVIDRARRVTGIVTRNDFFNCMDLTVYSDLQDKFRRFIHRTPGLQATKPESIGQIMSHPAVTLPDSAHIAELIPLMSVRGFRQIPIVNSERRLVGMVYQEDLIAGLYNEELILHHSA